MSVNIFVGALAMASAVAAAAAAYPPITDAIITSFAPVPTNSAQLDVDLVEKEFNKAGSHSTIEVPEPLAAVDAYTGPTSYGDKAINAPINCLRQDTYDGVAMWFDGAFDPNRCADACTARTKYNLANGYPNRPCRYFNTFVLKKNGANYAQYCSLYTQRWDGSYATNSGGYGLDGSAYTISQSVGYYTGSDPGPCQGVISSTTSTTSSTTTTLPPIGLPTAPCDSNGYLVRNNELDRINLASGRTTIVSLAVGTNVNGMGYNILDSYLYASSLLAITPTLVQIGGLGASVPVAQLPLPGGGSNYNLGDVDERGQYWASYNGQTWIQVDLAPGSPTRGSVFAMNVADPQGFVPLDWAYVPGGGDNLWALGTTPNYDTTQLMRFIREAGVWVLETNFGKIAGRNSWGAVFAGANQTLIGLENLSGEIWQFPLPVVGVTPQRLSYGPVNGGNTDGARCIKAL